MNNKEFCCEDFCVATKKKYVCQNQGRFLAQFCGSPSKMFIELDITFCPFCGQKLSKTEQE